MNTLVQGSNCVLAHLAVLVCLPLPVGRHLPEVLGCLVDHQGHWARADPVGPAHPVVPVVLPDLLDLHLHGAQPGPEDLAVPVVQAVLAVQAGPESLGSLLVPGHQVGLGFLEILVSLTLPGVPGHLWDPVTLMDLQVLLVLSGLLLLLCLVPLAGLMVPEALPGLVCPADPDFLVHPVSRGYLVYHHHHVVLVVL